MGVDWPGYNEALVRRGEILLDLSLLQGWGEELEPQPSYASPPHAKQIE